MAKSKKVPLWQKAVIQQQCLRGTPHENEWIVQDDETGAIMMHSMSVPTFIKPLLQALGMHPPSSPDEAMDKYFYEELCKPKKLSGTNEDILDRARKLHPEWPCPGSIQAMRARARQYRKKHGLPEIPPRKHK
jgi:hypothetical protein